jgi:hypothetical protein
MSRALLLVLALSGCTKTPAYVYGRSLNDLVFHVTGPDMGIHPDQTVLDDADNPFAGSPPSDDGKWALEAGAGPVAAFYSWATINAHNPYGEAQYYAGHDLQQIFRTGQAEDSLLPVAKDLSIRAYQAVLDHFPDSVTYDSTGKIPMSLATMSLQGILGLGGTPQGGWALVKGEDGLDHAVHP